MHSTFLEKRTTLPRDVISETLAKCLTAIPTTSIEKSVLPLAEQMMALLRHRNATSPVTSQTQPGRAITTDQAVHVVSKAVTSFVRAGKVVAADNAEIRHDMETACDDAILAGESLCRLLTARTNCSRRIGISPSSSSAGTSQNGTDSGVDEDLDEDASNETSNLGLSSMDPGPSASSAQSTCLTPPSGAVKSLNAFNLPFIRRSGGSVSKDDVFLSSLSYASDDAGIHSSLATSCEVLLTSVVRVLTLADSILVDEVIRCKDNVLARLDTLWKCENFRDFMTRFTEFGESMVKLAHFTGARHKDVKSSLTRSQMTIARSVLERETPILLAASKVWFQRPCPRSQAIRNCSFRRMRRALYRLHKIVIANTTWKKREKDIDKQMDRLRMDEEFDLPRCADGLFALLHKLEGVLRRTVKDDSSDLCDITTAHPVELTSENSTKALMKQIQESLEDFTDSPNTTLDQRIAIIDAIAMLQVSTARFEKSQDPFASSFSQEELCRLCKHSIKDLRSALQETALLHLYDATKKVCGTAYVLRESTSRDVVERLLKATQLERENSYELLEELSNASEKVCQACKLAAHCFVDQERPLEAVNIVESIRELEQQVKQAYFVVTTRKQSPASIECLAKVARLWRSYTTKDVAALKFHLSDMESQPRKFQSMLCLLQTESRLNTSQQKGVAEKFGQSIKLIVGQCRTEAHQLRRARVVGAGEFVELLEIVSEIVETAWCIYLFTKGEPPLRTTLQFFSAALELGSHVQAIERSINCLLGKASEEASSALCHLPPVVALLSSSRQALQITLRTSAQARSAAFQKVLKTLRDIKPVMELVFKVLVEINVMSTKKYTQVHALLRKDRQRSKSLTPRHRRHCRNTARQSSAVTSEATDSRLHRRDLSLERTFFRKVTSQSDGRVGRCRTSNAQDKVFMV